MSKYVEPFSPKLRNDEFGNLAPYRNGRPHRGQDWSAKELSPIKASAQAQFSLLNGVRWHWVGMLPILQCL
jgi:murein DD-endopeptidase MepM/ murein hydrolase activator NlpD